MLPCLVPLARQRTVAERFAAAPLMIACCRPLAFTRCTPLPLLAPAAYYLAPPLLKAGVGFLRGYAGDIAPAAALSAVESEVRLGGGFIRIKSAGDAIRCQAEPLPARLQGHSFITTRCRVFMLRIQRPNSLLRTVASAIPECTHCINIVHRRATL